MIVLHPKETIGEWRTPALLVAYWGIQRDAFTPSTRTKCHHRTHASNQLGMQCLRPLQDRVTANASLPFSSIPWPSVQIHIFIGVFATWYVRGKLKVSGENQGEN
jgi:hypothetical protein